MVVLQPYDPNLITVTVIPTYTIVDTTRKISPGAARLAKLIKRAKDNG